VSKNDPQILVVVAPGNDLLFEHSPYRGYTDYMGVAKSWMGGRFEAGQEVYCIAFGPKGEVRIHLTEEAALALAQAILYPAPRVSEYEKLRGKVKPISDYTPPEGAADASPPTNPEV
jgi:uncharacterized radical SAM superfamily protein